jgi:YHS domain-containing protein
MGTDPVCGMQVDESKDTLALPYEERTYYFCSEGCRAEFQRHPEDYKNDDSEERRGSV